MTALDVRAGTGTGIQVDLAVPSYLHECVVPPLATRATRTIRAWVVPPPEIEAWIAEARVDGAITVGFAARAPSSWESAPLATLRSALFASPRAAAELGAEPRLADVLARRFVGAVYPTRDGRLVEGDDRCPVARGERVVGHAVDSMRAACAVALETDQLVYGPEIAAAPFLADGRLVEISLAGWPRFDPVHFTFDPAVFDGADDVVGRIRRALTLRTARSDVIASAGALDARAREAG